MKLIAFHFHFTLTIDVANEKCAHDYQSILSFFVGKTKRIRNLCADEWFNYLLAWSKFE